MTDKQLKAVAMPGDFIFHSSWFEIFKSFDMATAYSIFMAMIAYVRSGEIPADEELRRLTVFLFAHIDTDRQRLLSLQPKRRTSSKKKPAAESKPETPQSTQAIPQPEQTKGTLQPAQVQDAPSDTSVISDSSVTSHPSHKSHKSHNSHISQPPQTQASRRARLTAYAQKVSDCIRRGRQLPDPRRVHKRNFKKRFKKSIPISSYIRAHAHKQRQLS